MSTPQLCDALAESSRFIAVAGGTMHSLSADGQKQQQPYFSSRSNFDQNSTLPMRDLDSFRGAETRPTGYIHGKVKDFDHYGVAESAWGYASLWQLEALQKQEMAAKYARTRGTATLRDSDSDDYALPAMNENRERPPSIFDKPGPLGVSDLGSIEAEFVKTSQPLVLASFATTQYMDQGIDFKSLNHRFMANNEEPDLSYHMIALSNSSVAPPDEPVLQPLRDWEMAAKRFDNRRVAGSRWLTLQPQAFDQMLEKCEELVYTQGTYGGVFDTVALPDL